MKRVFYWVDITVFLVATGITLAHWQWNARYLVGITLAGAGLVLWITARYQLGQSFSVMAQARKLVTRGLYSRIRNPIYFFGGIAILGLFVAWGKLILTLGFVAFYLLSQLVRAKAEAQVLDKAFGDEYRQYRKQTWF